MLRATIILVLVLGFALGAEGQPPAVCDLSPKRMVGLKYPSMAHFAGTEGKVELEAIVSSDGAVKETNIISGPPLLASWMQVALKDWRFTGCPQSAPSCRYKITFVFEMMTGSCQMDQCPNEIDINLPVITIRSRQARAIIN